MRRRLVVGTLLAAALVAAGCRGGDGDGAQAASDGTAPAGSEQGPCQPDLVVQTDWFPEVEHGGTYQLIGPGGAIDAERFAYAGPLRNRYKGAHGVQTVEIRAGGAAVDNRSVVDLMYADDSIDLGFVNTDDAIAAAAAGTPVVGVAGTLDISPQMLMWSPARYQVTDFDDLAATRAPVLHFPGLTYTDYLVSRGYVTADQLDGSYSGDPSRWLDSNGDLIQQGFATNEVYTYTEVLEGWKRPVDFFLVHWMGYENYPAMVVVRADRLAAEPGLRECLAALVPTLQQAWVDFLGEPQAMADELVAINDAYDTFFTITPGLNTRALEMFSQFELATNGGDDTYGNFDPARLERFFGIVGAVYAQRGTALPEGLGPDDVATNEFIDPAIGLARE